MQSGALRHRVTLETVAEAANVSGGLDTTYTVVATVWAKFEAKSGGRYVYGEQVERVATHQVTTRYLSTFRSVTHLSFDGRRFIVREARDPDERKIELRFLCEEMKDGV